MHNEERIKIVYCFVTLGKGHDEVDHCYKEVQN